MFINSPRCSFVVSMTVHFILTIISRCRWLEKWSWWWWVTRHVQEVWCWTKSRIDGLLSFERSDLRGFLMRYFVRISFFGVIVAWFFLYFRFFNKMVSRYVTNGPVKEGICLLPPTHYRMMPPQRKFLEKNDRNVNSWCTCFIVRHASFATPPNTKSIMPLATSENLTLFARIYWIFNQHIYPLLTNSRPPYPWSQIRWVIYLSFCFICSFIFLNLFPEFENLFLLWFKVNK